MKMEPRSSVAIEAPPGPSGPSIDLGGHLGLEIVRDCESPTVDLVFVHAVGAASQHSWRYMEAVNGKHTGKVINWLKDDNLLPEKIPMARVLAFNYNSDWLIKGTVIKLWDLGTELMRELHAERMNNPNKTARQRPICFVGHSFGGIIIEQGLVNASYSASEYTQIPRCTAGIVFLGTPQLESSGAVRGASMASLTNAFGLVGDLRLLNDLKEGSGKMKEIVHRFWMWVGKNSVDIAQFYETKQTNYGSRIGMRKNEMLVPEESACLPGYESTPLPTDHFKLSKFAGPGDPSYMKVIAVLQKMAHEAPEKAALRLNPRPFIQDNSQIPAVHQECQKALFLSWPESDLRGITRRLGKRTPGTCHWLLANAEYFQWTLDELPQVLRLIGGPGMEKTMLVTFVIEMLTTKLAVTPNMVMAYHFCDKNKQNTNSATSILRQLLFQLYQQRPKHFHLLQKAYDVQGDRLFTDFDTLWRILLDTLKGYGDGDVFILIDAIDECDRESRTLITEALDGIARSELNVRTLTTCRHEDDIEMAFQDEFTRTVAYSIKPDDIEKDLHAYLGHKVPEICRKRGWSIEREQMITDYLLEKANGTFQPWAQLLGRLERLDRQEPPSRSDAVLIVEKRRWVALQRQLSKPGSYEKKYFYEMLEILYNSCDIPETGETTVLIPTPAVSRSNTLAVHGNIAELEATPRKLSKYIKISPSEPHNGPDLEKPPPEEKEEPLPSHPRWNLRISNILRKLQTVVFFPRHRSEHDRERDVDASPSCVRKPDASSNMIWGTVVGSFIVLVIASGFLTLGVADLFRKESAADHTAPSWFSSDFYLVVSNSWWVALGVYGSILSTIKHYKENHSKGIWVFTWCCCGLCFVLCVLSPGLYKTSPAWSQLLSGLGSIVQVLIIFLTVWNLEKTQQFGLGSRNENESFELINLDASHSNSVMKQESNGDFDILAVMSGANNGRVIEAEVAGLRPPEIGRPLSSQQSRLGSFVSV